MMGKIIKRASGMVCSGVLVFLLLAGSVFAGESAPVPTPPTHSKISKAVKQHSTPSTSTANYGRLTWVEVIEMTLSVLGLI